MCGLRMNMCYVNMQVILTRYDDSNNNINSNCTSDNSNTNNKM